MTSASPPSRADVVALARQWIGTPYHHQASRLGAGVDCIGLVRGIWLSLYGFEPERLPGYARDWAEATGRETLIEAARRHLIEIDVADARSGDVVVFRYRPRLLAKHVGILAPALIPASTPSPLATQAETSLPWTARLLDEAVVRGPALGRLALIHAVEGAPVSEVALTPWWRRRMAAAFSFPGIID